MVLVKGADQTKADQKSARGFKVAAFTLLQVEQLEFGHTQNLGLERLAKELAANSESCEVGARRNVADKVCNAGGFPKRFGRFG